MFVSMEKHGARCPGYWPCRVCRRLAESPRDRSPAEAAIRPQIGACVETPGVHKAVHDNYKAYPGLDSMQKFVTDHRSILLRCESRAQEHDASFEQCSNFAKCSPLPPNLFGPPSQRNNPKFPNKKLRLVTHSNAVAQSYRFWLLPPSPRRRLGTRASIPTVGHAHPQIARTLTRTVSMLMRDSSRTVYCSSRTYEMCRVRLIIWSPNSCAAVGACRRT